MGAARRMRYFFLLFAKDYYSVGDNITFFLYKPLNRIGRMEVWLHKFLISALDWGKWSALRIGNFSSGI